MLVFVVALPLALVITLAAKGLYGLASWAISPPALLAIFFLNLGLLVFRLYAVLDAYLGTSTKNERPGQESSPPAGEHRPSPKMAATIGLVLILLATAAPHAVIGYYDYASYHLVDNVFGHQYAEETTNEDLDERLSILLIGTDAGMARVGKRADSIMVASFSLDTGQVALFGLPRETGSVPLEGIYASTLGQGLYKNPIGYLYSEANRYPDLAPAGGDAGAIVLREVVADILGIRIDHYAVINMDGFVDMVDALGGVTVDLPSDFYVSMPPLSEDDHWHTWTIPAGRQTLNGMAALELARSRAGNSDKSRMGRQRWILGTLLDQTGVLEAAVNLPAIADVVERSLETDMTVAALQRLVSAWPRLRIDQMVTVGLVPPHYTLGKNERGFDILDLDLVQSTVSQVLASASTAPVAGEASLDYFDPWDSD